MEVTPIRETVRMYQLPEWAHDTEGADGFEWRMYWLIGEMCGTEAISAVKAETPEEHQFHQWRERVLDSLMTQIANRLPPHSTFAADSPPGSA